MKYFKLWAVAILTHALAGCSQPPQTVERGFAGPSLSFQRPPAVGIRLVQPHTILFIDGDFVRTLDVGEQYIHVTSPGTYTVQLCGKYLKNVDKQELTMRDVRGADLRTLCGEHKLDTFKITLGTQKSNAHMVITYGFFSEKPHYNITVK